MKPKTSMCRNLPGEETDVSPLKLDKIVRLSSVENTEKLRRLRSPNVMRDSTSN